MARGSTSPYSRVRAEGVARLRPETPIEWGAPFEMLVDVLYAAEKLGDIRGRSIAVTQGWGRRGCWPCRSLAPWAPPEVIAIEPSPSRRQYAGGKLPWLQLVPAVEEGKVGIVDHGIECAGTASRHGDAAAGRAPAGGAVRRPARQDVLAHP